LIRHERLETVRRDLEDPAKRHCGVAVLAARWGFFDAATSAVCSGSTTGTRPRSGDRAPDLANRSFAVGALGIRRCVVTISGMVTVAEPVPLLLERDAEQARLSALLEQARAGRGAVVTISGPAGIGKTQLLAAVHRLAADRGFRSLRARGRELEADMAFSVVRQLLEQPVLSASAGERRRLLAGPGRSGRAGPSRR
jgi:hypothetical protein